MKDVRACGDVETFAICITEPHVRRADLVPRFALRLRQPKRTQTLALA
jgi:hypothetical protein